MSSSRGLELGRRRRSGISASSIVEAVPLEGATLPLLVRPRVPDVDLAGWALANRDTVDGWLLEHRALLFRGFAVHSADRLAQVASAISPGGLMDPPDESTPRRSLADRLYESTSYPPDQAIELHNEGSYCDAWPTKIFFACATAPSDRGETPIADVRRVAERIPPEILAAFDARGLLYVRHFNMGAGLTWQQAFWTESRDEVEAYCLSHGIEWEWLGGDQLRTTTRRRAVRTHPRTGERLWFNHGAFFNLAARPAEVQRMLVDAFGEERVPFDTRYGDGGRIERSAIEAIVEAYRAEEVAFRWARGDLLLLDNMTIAHGRRPYSGDRLIMVAMTDPDGDRGGDSAVRRAGAIES